MESEEVKDIKEKLQEEIFIANSFGDKIRKVPTKELEKILTLVNELESENKELEVLVDISNEREYRKKFIEEWRKEYQKELDKQGKGHIAGFPDFDLVYKLYFEQKDRIAELEDGITQSTLGCEFLPECTKEIAEKIWNMAKLVVVATKHIVQGREYLHLDALKEIIKSCGVEIKELDEYEKPENN